MHVFDIKGYVLSSKSVFYLEHNLALIKKKVARHANESAIKGAVWWRKDSAREKEFDVNAHTTE